MEERENNNYLPTTVPGQFSDAEERIFDDTTKEFWRESIRVCDEVERKHFVTNAATSPMQITQTIQQKHIKTKQKTTKNSIITNKPKNKKQIPIDIK